MRDLVGSASFGLMPVPVAPHEVGASDARQGGEAPAASRLAWGFYTQEADQTIAERCWADGWGHVFASPVAASPGERHGGSNAGWPSLSWLSHIRRWSRAPSRQL